MTITVDLHNHSRHGSYDGRRSYDEIAAECRTKGIDVAVITEHDTPTESAALADVSNRSGVLLLPGIELSFGDWGHYIVLGGEEFLRKQALRRFSKSSVLEVLGRVEAGLNAIPGPSLTFDDFMKAGSELRGLFKENLLNPMEFSRAARSGGAYVSWAHPFVATPLRKALDQFLLNDGRLDLTEFIPFLKRESPQVWEVVVAVDALEGINGLDRGLLSHLALAFARAAGKPSTAGSDGHREGEFGTAFMVMNCSRDDITDISSLISALRTCNWQLQTEGCGGITGNLCPIAMG